VTRKRGRGGRKFTGQWSRIQFRLLSLLVFPNGRLEVDSLDPLVHTFDPCGGVNVRPSNYLEGNWLVLVYLVSVA